MCQNESKPRKINDLGFWPAPENALEREVHHIEIIVKRPVRGFDLLDPVTGPADGHGVDSPNIVNDAVFGRKGAPFPDMLDLTFSVKGLQILFQLGQGASLTVPALSKA